MGLLYLITGTFQSYHVDFTGLTAQDVRTFNEDLMNLISIFIRMGGVSVLGLGVTNVLIIPYAFRKGMKWAWIVCLISGIVVLIPTLIITFPVLSPTYIYAIFIIAAILWLLAVLLAGYEIFIKKTE